MFRSTTPSLRLTDLRVAALFSTQTLPTVPTPTVMHRDQACSSLNFTGTERCLLCNARRLMLRVLRFCLDPAGIPGALTLPVGAIPAGSTIRGSPSGVRANAVSYIYSRALTGAQNPNL